MYASEVEREINLQEFLKRKEHRQRYSTTSYKTYTDESAVKRPPLTCTVQTNTKFLIKKSKRASLETVVKNEKPRVKKVAKKSNVVHKKKIDQVKPVQPEAVPAKNIEDHDSGKGQSILDTPVLSPEPGNVKFSAALETIHAILNNTQVSPKVLLAPIEPEDKQQVVEKGDKEVECVPQAEDSPRRSRFSWSVLRDKAARIATTLMDMALIVTTGVALSFLDCDWEWLLEAVSTFKEIDVFQ